MSHKNAKWQLKGLKKHNVLWFPIIEEQRRETLEETLNGLRFEEKSTYTFDPRTTHLYKSDLQTLEKILSAIKENSDFTSSDIIHSSSDLGLTHRIQATHKSGAIFFFDGLHIRVTKKILDGSLKLDELLPKTGVPKVEWNIINAFIACIQKVFPKKNIESFSSYYTIDNTNWEKIGVKRHGDAQLSLVINDPNYLTVTALIFTKWGKDFKVYLGEEDRIHQMIAHDFFIDHEIAMFTNFYDSMSKTIVNYQSRLKTDFGGIISPLWKVLKKHEKWNSVKNTMRAIYATKDLVEKGKLLLESIKLLTEKKWAFFNGPRQIWLIDEPQDSEEKVQHPTKHFFVARLEGSEIKIPDDGQMNPSYLYAYHRLDRKVEFVSDQINELYQRERDLLTAFQTEFSLYAVWIALIAITIAIISLFVR